MRHLVASCLFAATLATAAAPPASALEVWFAPNDNLVRGPNRDKILNRDFPQLFDEHPAWSAKIDAFIISPLMGSTVGPEDALRRINGFLAERHIALGVGVGTALVDNVNPVPGECGFGMEGMNRPNRNAVTFQRLKRLGIQVAFVAMDEPLTFGHYFQKANACRFSLPDTARRVAAAIAEIRQSYPNVGVIDYEVPTNIPPAQYLADLPRWLDAYRRDAGTPFDAMIFDVNWNQPWRQVVPGAVTILHAHGVKAGIILDGNGPGQSDAEAAAFYRENMASVAALNLPLDIVEVANWTPHPTRNLPESDPDTLTSLLAWYNAHYRH